MGATDTMKWMGRSTRNRAQTVRHSVKDRVLEKRLERASDEADRLRTENDRLRDEVAETRSEHHRILDLLETRLAAADADEKTKRSHKGRWLLFLTAIGGGVYALIRRRSNATEQEWSGNGNLDRTAPMTTSDSSTI